jgi:hypothetical protein
MSFLNTRIKLFVIRDANSLAIFIPRGFGESGNGNCHSLGTGKLKPISRVLSSGFGGILGSFCFKFEVNLKFIFVEKNNMILMIRNDEIAGN